MGLDGLVGGFIVFLIVISVLGTAGGALFDYFNDERKKHKREREAQEEHEAKSKYQSQFGQNEEYKTKWRQNEKYNDILTNSITAIRNIANEEEKRILYSDNKMAPKSDFYITFYRNTISCYIGEPGDYGSSFFSTSYEGYNISDEQRRALLRALKEDIEKEIPKLICNFYDTGLRISVANYQHYIEKKDIF